MKLEDSTRFTASCFRGELASCSCACPFHMDIRAFLEKASKGRWLQAYKTLRNATVFPAIVSILCDHPCQSRCQRSLTGDESIDLGKLEAASIRYAKNRKPESYVIPPKSQRIAIVGAGPAGLSCALNLAQKKFPVTVFEKESGWGGALRAHPRFAEFDADIVLQFSAVQTEFRYGTKVKILDELNEFDAIYIATGVGGNSFGLIDSWDAKLLTTSTPKVFMGGALCDVPLMKSIAQGIELSRTIEVFLQTGKAAGTYGDFDKDNRGRYLDHTRAASVPRVQTSSPDGYTEKEAKAEAARCLQCDCNNCMAACEMLKRFRKVPHKIAVEVFNDMGVNPPFSVHTLTREVYSCNICGYCKSVCPVNVDMGELLQFARSARKSADRVDPSAALHDFWMREMEFATSEGAFASAPKGKKTCDYAFYPGCRLGASNPEHVQKSYRYLFEKFDAGIMLGCCGAPAYWAGDDVRMKSNIEKIRQDWKDLGNPILVFACATCEILFQKYLPEIKRISLYELLAGEAEIMPVRIFQEAAIFDPCAAREDNAMQAGIRKLAAKAGVAIEELRERNRCCGYGGHMRVANSDLYDEIVQNRITESEKPYIVYCANCKEVFAEQGKECAHILDMVFDLKTDRRVLSIHEKKNNSLKVKKELMKEITGKDFQPETHAWDDLTLVISEDLLERMNKKLISTDDVKETIWWAENSGDKFVDERDGMCLASMVKSVLTYWVQYKPTASKTYEVFSAYYHRMRFNREE
jgi:Fe-S oxidoreductase